MQGYDPDLVRWGLHQLDGGFIFNTEADDKTEISNGPTDMACHDVYLGSTGYLRGGTSNTASDEVLAHALQEELSRLNAVESSEGHRISQTLGAEVLAQDWSNPNYSLTAQNDRVFGSGSNGSGNDNADILQQTGKAFKNYNDFGLVSIDFDRQREMERRSGGASYSCRGSYDDQDDDNDKAIALVLSEEYSQLDGEVGRRLTHMESIPHVPKINGELPTDDDESMDHKRLLDRLSLYGLCEHKIYGDGNCQFRALSDQLYRTPDHHKFVRKEIVNQLKTQPEPYEGYVPMKYSDYLKKMAKSGEWGDHVTLQAAADSYGVKICLLTSFKDTCFIEITPKKQKSDRVIFLSFWAEVHYNSIYPEGDDIPASKDIKKKRHWLSLF